MLNDIDRIYVIQEINLICLMLTDIDRIYVIQEINCLYTMSPKAFEILSSRIK